MSNVPVIPPCAGSLGSAISSSFGAIGSVSSAYFIGRQAIREVPLGAHRLKEGSLVFINIYGMHRRADVFPEPERFLPERFEVEAEKRLPRLAYLPFGAGPRICIGNHFALMEGQILLAALAQRVTFELAAGQRVVPEPLVTLRPRGGLPMTLRRRIGGERTIKRRFLPSRRSLRRLKLPIYCRI